MRNYDNLIIDGKNFNSRLLLGTGKYPNVVQMQSALLESECEIVTVAIRRLSLFENNSQENIISTIDWNRFWLLPNTAGAKTTEEAIRLAFLGRELSNNLGQLNNNFVKLEVISDSKYLFPDPIGTLKAAEFLVKKGFTVLPYTNTDPMLAKHLEDIGCAAIMPLGSPIGSGQGILNKTNIAIIIENATVPIIVDAGIGSPSDASRAMELGAAAVLINTAIAKSQNPSKMAHAMNLAVKAGRYAFTSGIIEPSNFAHASSPLQGSSFLS